MAGRTGRRGFGRIRRLPSGRYQASYVGPDMVRHNAPTTFEAKIDAEEWLASRRREMVGDEWKPPKARQTPTLDAYAADWLAHRRLKARTRELYASLQRTHILPVLGAAQLHAITTTIVREWYAELETGPTAKANAYGHLRTLFGSAVDDGLIGANPCRIRGAGAKKRAKPIRPASLDELATIVKTVPAKYEAMILLTAWCGLRFGELAGLTRSDIDQTNAVVRVRRGVVRVGGQLREETPKTDAGTRPVHIPPHVMPAVKQHLREHVGKGREAPVFAGRNGGYMPHSALRKVFNRARLVAGRPDLTPHALRHTGATLAAQAGATTAELMARIGHSTPQAAMIYQHAASERDAEIARRLSKLAKPKKAKKATGSTRPKGKRT